MAERDETPDKLIGSIPYGSVRQRIRAQDSIPYGSLKPNVTPTVLPDGEKLTIPYGSLKTTAPAPVPQTTPTQPVSQTPPRPPWNTVEK